MDTIGNMSEQERSHWRQWMNDMERWATMKSPIPAQGVRKLLEYMHDLEDLVADNVTLTDATLGGKSETLLNIVKARVSERRKA